MSPAMIVLAGSRVVGAMLRAKRSVPPRLGVAALARARPAARRALPLAEAGAAVSVPRSVAAEPATPYFNKSRRVSGFLPGVCTFRPLSMKCCVGEG